MKTIITFLLVVFSSYAQLPEPSGSGGGGGTTYTFNSPLSESAGAVSCPTCGTGDTSTNTGTSVDSEVALFSGTGGKTLKRASATGIAKLTSGVLSAATAGTDYVLPALADTYANIAAATCDAANTGRLGFVTDSVYTARCNGSAWQWWMGSMPVTPPPTSGWSWVNQESSTITENGHFTIVADTVDAGNHDARLRVRSYSGNTTVTAVFGTFLFRSAQAIYCGFRQSSSGKFTTMVVGIVSAGNTELGIFQMTDEVTFSAAPLDLIDDGWVFPTPVHVKIQDNGTNLLFSVSPDGRTWQQIYSESRTSFMTSTGPDQLIWGARGGNATAGEAVTLYSWKQE